MVKEIKKKEGRVDVLIHAAGVERSRKLENKPLEEFENTFAVKADGFFNLYYALQQNKCLPRAVVSFSSVAGRLGNSGQTDYAAANDLLARLALAMRREVIDEHAQLVVPTGILPHIVALTPRGFQQLGYVRLQASDRTRRVVDSRPKLRQLLPNARLFQLAGLRGLRHLVTVLLERQPMLRPARLACLEVLLQTGLPAQQLSRQVPDFIDLLLERLHGGRVALPLLVLAPVAPQVTACVHR